MDRSVEAVSIRGGVVSYPFPTYLATLNRGQKRDLEPTGLEKYQLFLD
jgi:hypothetical protein